MNCLDRFKRFFVLSCGYRFYYGAKQTTYLNHRLYCSDRPSVMPMLVPAGLSTKYVEM